MYKKNKREKSIEFWAQPKLKLLGKNWSFYTKKILYVIKYKHIIGYNNAA